MKTKTLAAAALLVAVASAPVYAQPTPATPAASAPPPASGEDDALYSCKKRTGQVAVTFKPETELKDLITWVMGFTCKNFMLDPRIVSTGKKVTVIAPNKMSASEAYNVFLAALSTMGLTVVPKGRQMVIVEAAGSRSSTPPLYRDRLPDASEQIVRYVMRPQYAQPEALRQAVSILKSDAGDVQAVGSFVLVTDRASNVRDMAAIAKLVDVPGGTDGLYTIPVQHADAQKLADKLKSLLEVSAPKPGTAIVPSPMSQPRTPPATAPAPAPATAASGALVCASCAKSREPSAFGISTEMSLLRNPAARNASTALSRR